ncbi:MAG: hypothetical protein ACKOYK_08585 [Cyanobium sp.]
MAQTPGFFLSQHDHFDGFLSKPLKHGAALSAGRTNLSGFKGGSWCCGTNAPQREPHRLIRFTEQRADTVSALERRVIDRRSHAKKEKVQPTRKKL